MGKVILQVTNRFYKALCHRKKLQCQENAQLSGFKCFRVQNKNIYVYTGAYAFELKTLALYNFLF